MLRNCPDTEELKGAVEALDVDRGTEVRLTGGGSAIEGSHWLREYATALPDVVLMCLDSRPNEGYQRNPWYSGEEATGAWWLKKWEEALDAHPELAARPRVLLHWKSEPTQIDSQRFFRVLTYDCRNLDVVRALRDAISSATRRVPHVFISYSSKDRRFVDRLGKDLVTRGVKIWIDRMELRVGDSLIERLRDAIDRVDFVLAVISNHSIASAWVRKELDIAMTREIGQQRLVVLPICRTKAELPGFIKGKVYADFSDSRHYAEAFEQLVQTLMRDAV